MANYQSQPITKCCWLSKSYDHRKQLEGRKKVYYFENRHFQPPQKTLGYA